MNSGSVSMGTSSARPPLSMKHHPGNESRLKLPRACTAGSSVRAETPMMIIGGPKSLMVSRTCCER